MRYRPIRRNSEFGRVYARGKSYVNPALVLYVLKTRGRSLIRQPGLGKQLCHNAAQLPAFQLGGHAPGHEDQVVAADIVIQMLVNSGLHHAAGAVALHGVADLFGSGQPLDRPQLPVFAQLQQLHHAGHSDPRLYQGHSAGGLAHCPVQSAGEMGLRPRPAARPLAKPRPQLTARKAV